MNQNQNNFAFNVKQKFKMVDKIDRFKNRMEENRTVVVSFMYLKCV